MASVVADLHMESDEEGNADDGPALSSPAGSPEAVKVESGTETEDEDVNLPADTADKADEDKTDSGTESEGDEVNEDVRAVNGAERSRRARSESEVEEEDGDEEEEEEEEGEDGTKNGETSNGAPTGGEGDRQPANQEEIVRFFEDMIESAMSHHKEFRRLSEEDIPPGVPMVAVSGVEMYGLSKPYIRDSIMAQAASSGYRAFQTRKILGVAAKNEKNPTTSSFYLRSLGEVLEGGDLIGGGSKECIYPSGFSILRYHQSPASATDEKVPFLCNITYTGTPADVSVIGGEPSQFRFTCMDLTNGVKFEAPSISRVWSIIKTLARAKHGAKVRKSKINAASTAPVADAKSPFDGGKKMKIKLKTPSSKSPKGSDELRSKPTSSPVAGPSAAPRGTVDSAEGVVLSEVKFAVPQPRSASGRPQYVVSVTLRNFIPGSDDELNVSIEGITPLVPIEKNPVRCRVCLTDIGTSDALTGGTCRDCTRTRDVVVEGEGGFELTAPSVAGIRKRSPGSHCMAQKLKNRRLMAEAQAKSE